MEQFDGLKSLADVLPLRVSLTPSRKTERGELYRTFMNELNPSRAKKGLRPITEARLATIFQGVPESDLYYLDSECRKARNYSALFWYKLKKVNSPHSSSQPSKAAHTSVC